jgi:hypothetical protein
VKKRAPLLTTCEIFPKQTASSALCAAQSTEYTTASLLKTPIGGRRKSAWIFDDGDECHGDTASTRRPQRRAAPIAWHSDRDAGFSTTNPVRLSFAVVMDPVEPIRRKTPKTLALILSLDSSYNHHRLPPDDLLRIPTVRFTFASRQHLT